jgi:hypothetical protein
MQKHNLRNPFLLLSADAAEGAVLEVPSDVADLLSTDLGSVDTSFPLLKEGLYDMAIESCDIVDNKEKTGKNIKIVLRTTADAQSVKGEPLNAGMKLTTYIGLTETEKYGKEAIARNAAGFVQATRFSKLGPIEQFKDEVVRVKVSIRPAKGQYEAANDVKWVPAAKA